MRSRRLARLLLRIALTALALAGIPRLAAGDEIALAPAGYAPASPAAIRAHGTSLWTITSAKTAM
jgi:hypothetical protein